MKLHECDSYEISPLAMGTASQYCLRWNNHQTNLLTSFDSLLRQEAFTDVTLACEDGINLHAHRLVLAACSSYFSNLFSTTSPIQHPIVVLKDVQATEMRALLNYMYRGEVNVEQSHLKALLKVAEGLRVKGLVEDLATDTQTQPLPLLTSHSRPLPLLVPSTQNQSNGYSDSRSVFSSVVVKEPCDTPASSESWDHDIPFSSNCSRRSFCSPPLSPSRQSHSKTIVKDEYLHSVRALSSPTHPYIEHLPHIPTFNHQSRIPPIHMDPKELRSMRESYEKVAVDTSPRHSSDDPRERRALTPQFDPLHPSSPPVKRSRHFIREPLLSPTPILRTALAHSRSFTPDVPSLVSLANSMMPLPPLLSTRVPSIVSKEESRRAQELQHEPQQPYNVHNTQPYSAMKIDHLSDDESRHFSDKSREEECQERLNNGPIIHDFSSYHLERSNPAHFSNFVSYVPTPKPEWKRYKQYTKTDLMDAIAAVKKGMTALQASRKYKVPSRTLYDKIKKMGINTLPRRLPTKRGINTDIEQINSSSAVPMSGSLNRQSPPRDRYDRTSNAREGGEVSSTAVHLSAQPLSQEEKRERSDECSEGSASYQEDSPVETSTRGSFSLVGRQVFTEEETATPLDLTEAEVIPSRTQIEERA